MKRKTIEGYILPIGETDPCSYVVKMIFRAKEIGNFAILYYPFGYWDLPFCSDWKEPFEDKKREFERLSKENALLEIEVFDNDRFSENGTPIYQVRNIQQLQAI